MMATSKKQITKAAESTPAKSQAQRFLEAVRKAQVDQSGRAFNRAMGKVTLTKNARKTAKGQVGG